jgi:hypothetical protein
MVSNKWYRTNGIEQVARLRPFGDRMGLGFCLCFRIGPERANCIQEKLWAENKLDLACLSNQKHNEPKKMEGAGLANTQDG